jgi:hypothetical protein
VQESHGISDTVRTMLARGTPKGQTLERRRRTCQEGSSGIRIQDFKKQLCQRSESTSDRIQENHWAGDSEVNSRIFRQDSKNECQDIVERSASSGTKEETAHSRNHKSRSMGHNRNFWPHQPEEDDGDTPESTGTLSGSCSGRAGLRRERLDSKHRKNAKPRGGRWKPSTDITTTALGK